MKKLQVLLVEDNPGDVELTRQALAASSLKLELTVLEDGEQALKYLRREAPYTGAGLPDLLLLDLNLPKVSGEEVLREVKADKQLRRLPVVILTSSEAETEISRCYSEGANCYVVKPSESGSFLTVVKTIELFWLSVTELNLLDQAGEQGSPKAGKPKRL